VLTPAPVAKYAPEELAAMFPQRTQPNAAIMGLAQAGWTAVTSPEPRAIENFVQNDSSALPFLAAALRRLLQELPEPASGLSRTDRAILETGGDFKAAQAREEIPFMTDLFFALRVEELHGALSEAQRKGCLAGRLDYRQIAKTRWVGGVRLEGPACARWDGSRVVAP
jgi:hypothetical protein